MKEEVAVAEATAACWFSREHVQPLPFPDDGECADSILPPALEIAHRVDLLGAFFVVVHHRFVVHDIQRIAFSIHNPDLLGRDTSPSTAESSSTPTSVGAWWASSPPSYGCAGLAAFFARLGGAYIVSRAPPPATSSSSCSPWNCGDGGWSISPFLVFLSLFRIFYFVLLRCSDVRLLSICIDHFLVGSILLYLRRGCSCSISWLDERCACDWSEVLLLMMSDLRALRRPPSRFPR